MEEKFVYLLNASEAECKLIQQRLKEVGINSKIDDYIQNAFSSIYGANSLIGKKIIIPESKLNEAKKILNITEEKIGKKKLFSKSKKPIYIFIRIIILLFLIVLGVLYIFSTLNH